MVQNEAYIFGWLLNLKRLSGSFAKVREVSYLFLIPVSLFKFFYWKSWIIKIKIQVPGAHPSKVIPTVTLTLRSQGHAEKWGQKSRVARN